jgi:hypothetical protein
MTDCQAKTITQGHPTYDEPDQNKGGQDGAPKPDGRTPPAEGADSGANSDHPGRGGD